MHRLQSEWQNSSCQLTGKFIAHLQKTIVMHWIEHDFGKGLSRTQMIVNNKFNENDDNQIMNKITFRV